MNKEITRRNFLKSSVTFGAGALVIGSGSFGVQAKPKPVRHYTCSVRSRNPCGEIAFIGKDRKKAEGFASRNFGVVDYTEIIDGHSAKGSYTVPLADTLDIDNQITLGEFKAIYSRSDKNGMRYLI